MKKLLLSLILVGSVSLMNAQSVITFLEDFQENPVLSDAIAVPFDAEEGDWINYDADEITTNADQGNNWYLGRDVKYSTADEFPGDTNLVARSDSWLAGFAPENRNYLILPEIEITDEAHFFSWKSGAFQGPRFMDGYSIGIVTNFEDPEDSFVRLWQAAQFVADDNGWHPALYGSDYDFAGCQTPGVPVADMDLSAVCYFPAVGDGTNNTGYVHANNFTDMTVLGLQNNDPASTSYICLLEQHEIDLSAYIGQAIRICVLHDSDDDNFITVDDLMVSSGITDGVPNIVFERFINMYPNPVTDVLNFNFTGEVKDNAVINVIDTKGAVVYSEVVSGGALQNTVSIDLGASSAGLYSVSITIDNKQTVTNNIVKR